jgi:transposase
LAAAYQIRTGVRQFDIARMYGVSRTTASRWCRALKTCGEKGLRRRIATGRPPRLSADKLAEVERIISANPHWNYREVGEWITRNFEVTYHNDHIGRIAKRLGFKRRRRGPKRPVET